MWATMRARRERRAEGRREGRRILRSAALVSVVAASALVLAGCSSVIHSNPPIPSIGVAAPSAKPATPAPTSTGGTTASSPATAPSTGTAAVGTAYQPVAPGTVVAVGEIQSTDGKTRGHVVIKNVVGDQYDLIVSGYSTNVGGERAVALARTDTPTPDECLLGTDSIQVGALAPGVDQVVTAYLPPEKTGGDPSNLKSLSFATLGGDTTGCGGSITAHATLSWAFPTPYDHVAVVDGGAGPGARGAVELADGVPVRYTVAAGDTLTAVLSRFGLSIGELQYLNPGSFQKGTDSVPEQGFSWNLSAKNR